MGNIIDRTGANDAVQAVLDRTVKAPNHPCGSCGAETKEHHPVTDGDVILERRRICSKPSCRAIESIPVS